MTYLLIGLAMASLAAWILRPLFLEPRLAPSEESHSPAESSLLENKEAVYRSILDLEFDHSLGKVSDDDYAVLRKQHETEAIGLIREMDRRSNGQGEADLLEAEIAEARRQRRS